MGLGVGMCAGVVARSNYGLYGDYDPRASINSNLVWMINSHPSDSPLLETELVSRGAVTLNDITHDRDWTVTGETGLTWKSYDSSTSGATNTAAAHNLGTALSGDFTIFYLGRNDANPTDYFDLFGIANGANVYCAMEVDPDTSDQLFWYGSGSGVPTDFQYFGTSTSTPAEWSFGIVRSGSTWTRYWNGSSVGSGTSSGTATIPSAGNVNWGGLSSWCLDGAVHQIRIWSRALSSGDMSTLHSTPMTGCFVP